MTRTRIGLCAAVLLAVAIPASSWAQDTEPSEPAQEEMVPDPDGQEQDGMMNGEPEDEAIDPASPEAESMGEPMEEAPETDMGETQAPEETGPQDMISDSSERPLARADVEALTCDELWIARNEIFDRNGYCFRSERGQDYFDNSDCTSDSQDILSSLEWENVRLIQSVESEKQCN